jgi:hypothetical protein
MGFVPDSRPLFEQMLSHGICPRCQRLVMRQWKWRERARDTRRSEKARIRARQKAEATAQRIERLTAGRT